MYGQMWWSMLLIPIPTGQRQAELHELEASMVYVVSLSQPKLFNDILSLKKLS